MILIISDASDTHASIVNSALNSIGKRSVIKGFFNFPSSARISCNPNESPRCLHDEEDLGPYSSIWYRRDALIDTTSIADANKRETIERECIAARRACYAALEDGDAIWFNDWKAAWAAENKAAQLSAARKVGFQVPDTLISNDPDQVRGFWEQHQAAGVIHKMFYPAQFGNKTACTAPLSAAALANDRLISAVPGIYQRRLALQFDLRVFVAGRSAIAAKLQSENKQFVDSRILSHRPGCVHPWALDSAVQDQCVKLLQRLGLVTGSIDLGVTTEGELVFFEVNQSGNFLWMEQCNPDLPVLDFQCRFLASGDPGFEYTPSGNDRLAFSSFAN